MEKIKSLEGRPIFLTSSHFPTKVLSIVFNELVVATSAYSWKLVPFSDNEFIILSNNIQTPHVICSRDGTHEKAELFNIERSTLADRCLWRATPEGEFYQELPRGMGKIYLWVVNKELRTTPDSYLAELWEFYRS